MFTVKLKFLILLPILLLATLPLVARVVKGKVLDENKQPLPFTTISLKGLDKKAVSNSNGEFNFDLPDGNYTLVYQHVGYATLSQELILNGNTQFLYVYLKPTELTLKEVVVKQGAKDPAYAIIRSAIKERKYNGNKAGAYYCEAYIKGLISI